MNEAECRMIVRVRADGMCERCTRGGAVTLHHRRNRSQLHKSRHWEPANCVMLCGDGVRGCHGWVTVRPTAAHAEGWHVKPWEEPQDVPVYWRGYRWVLLDSDGGMSDAEKRA